MNRTSKFLLGMFVLIALSCNALERSLPTSDPSTLEPESLAKPTTLSISELESTSTPKATFATATQCDGDKWTFGPQAVYRYPGSDGFDVVLVDVAVHNGSDRYWGSTTIPFSNIYITTEGGFTYTPFNGSYQIPASPKSPYSGTQYDQYNMISRGTPLMPPGFTALGALGSGGFGGGNRHTVYPYTFGFEVASSQKSLTLNIKDLGTLCYDPQNPEAFGDRFSLLSYSLFDLAHYKMPTEIDYPELGSQSIVVPDKGTFEYTGYTNHGGFYLLNFSFTNASAGYNVNGSFNAYLVGDDGVFRSPDDDGASSDCPFYLSYDAGPIQTVALCPIPFKIPAGVNNLKFIFYDRDYYTNRAFAAFGFVPSSSTISSSTPGASGGTDQDWNSFRDMVIQTIRTINSYKTTTNGQDADQQGQILPYEAVSETVIDKMHNVKQYENGDILEEVWDRSEICTRRNNSQWECRSGETLVGDFHAFMINVVEGKPTWNGPAVIDHGSTLASYDEKDCRLYFSEELFNGNGYQTNWRFEICFDLVTYFPMYEMVVYKNIVNDSVIATTRSETQYYDINVPLEITLPRP